MTGVPEIRSGARTAGREGYEAGIMFGHDVRAACTAVSARPSRPRLSAARPSLGEGVSPQISYRVGGALYAKARAKARAQGCTVGQFARQALEEYINR